MDMVGVDGLLLIYYSSFNSSCCIGCSNFIRIF